MKRISIYANPHVRRSGSYFGYAYTYNEIARFLQTCVVENEQLKVDLNSPKSKMQMCYGTPPGFFYQHQYKIQMTQWESTLVPPSWAELAKGYDEYWTANYFGKQAFINAGVPESKLYVYEHGMDAKTWTPSLRGKNDKIRFLHIDSGSPRKRADLAEKAFVAAFGNNTDYELTLKWSHTPHENVDWSNYKVLATRGTWQRPNVRHLHENLSLEDLVRLFHFHDVLIFPSEGEGFGLIPLQALATGMPVISTGVWCSYEDFLLGNVIESKMGASDVIETYTRYGNVVLPDFDSTVDLMRYVAKNIAKQSKKFMDQVPKVVEKYDWQKLTQQAVDGLVSRVGMDMFSNYKGYLAD